MSNFVHLKDGLNTITVNVDLIQYAFKHKPSGYTEQYYLKFREGDKSISHVQYQQLINYLQVEN